MEQVIVTDQAQVLIPNGSHKNFTASREVMPKGIMLTGEFIVIEGLRRGQPFQYRLFKIENTNNYIFTNKTQKTNTMEKTEVTLGADAKVSPTVVDIPSNAKANKMPIIAAVIGAGAGFGFAKYRKVEGNAKWIYVAVGAVAGYFVGKMIANKKAITVVKSK
jgi:hypothetical protein